MVPRIELFPQLNPLHYVDVPKGETSYDRERDCPQRNCVVEAINWYLNVLKANDSPLAEKELALDYLVHLVGDLHQPLHVGFLDDMGGTKTVWLFKQKLYVILLVFSIRLTRVVASHGRWHDGAPTFRLLTMHRHTWFVPIIFSSL